MQTFPDVNAETRLRHITSTRWGSKMYMDMKRRRQVQPEAA